MLLNMTEIWNSLPADNRKGTAPGIRKAAGKGAKPGVHEEFIYLEYKEKNRYWIARAFDPSEVRIAKKVSSIR